MHSDALPQEITRFLRSHIVSVGQLEILLLLRSTGGPLSAEQINQAQRSSLASVHAGLGMLKAHGLVATSQDSAGEAFSYQPANGELAHAVDLLAAIYADYPVRVISAIYSPSDPMQSFADAFRLRKDTDTHG